jgi:hypothetical protein
VRGAEMPFAGTLPPGTAGQRLAWRPAAPGEHRHGRPLRAALAAAGVPAEWRRAWPVLEAGGTILWVPGVDVHTGSGGQGAHEIGLELEVPW